MLPAEHEWVDRLNAMRRDVLERIQQGNIDELLSRSREMSRTLQSLKQEYITVYAALHAKARLGANDDRRK
ncbi:MAG: hypothetical protein GY794_21060, partial [bacterium]|nr:hypothetical protein [bacterium]